MAMWAMPFMGGRAAGAAGVAGAVCAAAKDERPAAKAMRQSAERRDAKVFEVMRCSFGAGWDGVLSS
jgi:hypothetical protein